MPELITGTKGTPHVTSTQDRSIYEKIIGKGSYILDDNELLEPELQSNQSLRIRSGMLYHHGSITEVKRNTYDEVTIANGSQGMKRIDLVVLRYTKNPETEIEETNWVVIQGTPAANDPVAPAYTEGNMQEGDLTDDCPFCEVHLDGIQITEVVKLMKVLDGSLESLNSKIDNSAGSVIGGHGTEEKVGFYIDANGEKRTLYSKRVRSMSSPISLPSGCDIVAVDAWMQHNTEGYKYPFPYIDTGTWKVTQITNYSKNSLSWKTGGIDWTNYTAVFVFYYVK